MNVATITMEPDTAREKLRALRRQLHRRADAEYETLARGYEQLVDGKPVLSLEAAIRGAPCDDKDRPRLAIGRADREQVKFEWAAHRERAIFDTSRSPTTRSETLWRTIDMGRQHEYRARYAWEDESAPLRPQRVEGWALLPLVPAEVVQLIGGGSNLRHFFVLWEVEQWADRPIVAEPDRDPYLLRHLGGDLYAVVAEWELTELERLVMVGRREA